MTTNKPPFERICDCGFSSNNYREFNQHLKKCPSNRYTKKVVPKEAQEILQNPDLFAIITEREFDKRIVGERGTREAIFLSLCPIWVKGAQLNTLVNSPSSTGKSYVCKNVCRIFPEGAIEYRTKISPQAFTYWHQDEPDWSWSGKVCYLEDVGDSLVNADTFKIMCSEGTEATVVVRQKAVTIRIEGKPCVIVTTASATPNFEVMNRFNLISLDETQMQTKAIMDFQASCKENHHAREYDENIRTALGYLEQVEVTIPFAKKLTQHFPTQNIRARRDFDRFLQLVEASTALHQMQRERRNGQVIAVRLDYELARRAMAYISHDANPSLTYQQRKAYNACLACANNGTLEPKGFTVKEVWAKNPFCSERMWYDHVKALTELGLLEVRLEKRDRSDRDVSIFFPRHAGASLNLPEFDALDNSFASNPSKGIEAIDGNER